MPRRYDTVLSKVHHETACIEACTRTVIPDSNANSAAAELTHLQKGNREVGHQPEHRSARPRALARGPRPGGLHQSKFRHAAFGSLDTQSSLSWLCCAPKLAVLHVLRTVFFRSDSLE